MKLFDWGPLNYTKGQLISEWSHEVIVSSKIRTKNCQSFCPHYKGQKSWQVFVHILGQTITSLIHSENNWPLGQIQILCRGLDPHNLDPECKNILNGQSKYIHFGSINDEFDEKPVPNVEIWIYSRDRNRHSPLNKHSLWKNQQKQ